MSVESIISRFEEQFREAVTHADRPREAGISFMKLGYAVVDEEIKRFEQDEIEQYSSAYWFWLGMCAARETLSPNPRPDWETALLGDVD